MKWSTSTVTKVECLTISPHQHHRKCMDGSVENIHADIGCKGIKARDFGLVTYSVDTLIGTHIFNIPQ